MLTCKYRIVETMCCLYYQFDAKSIGEFLEHKAMIETTQRICHWLYYHNNLHAMMRTTIGGELPRCNATYFGTN
jgi:hypothetical protein